MDVLTLLMMRFFAHTRECKYQDPGINCIGEEDSDSSEMEEGTSSRSGRQSSFQISGRVQQKCDRAAWGTYMENAPPILPSNTFVPGFENETLRIAIGLHDELDNNSFEGDDDDDDAEQTDAFSDIEDKEDSEKRMHARSRLEARARPARQNRLPRVSSILESLPTLYVNNLFGCRSNSRATTTTTKENKSVHRSSSMASKTHVWVSLWFLLTAPVIFWDVGYCFMRCESFCFLLLI